MCEGVSECVCVSGFVYGYRLDFKLKLFHFVGKILFSSTFNVVFDKYRPF